MPETWLRVTVTSPSDELVPLLAEGLLACGGSAVEESGLDLSTYLTPHADGEAQRRQLREALESLAGRPVQVRAETVPDEDWLAQWRAGLDARRIGGRIVVAPTWIDTEAAPGEIVIRIDPQMAFGTGEHASTRGVLRLMQDIVTAGSRVLDVGAGSAILAIAAARLGAAEVQAVESDPDAIENATDNVVANGVGDRVSVRLAQVDDAFLRSHGHWDGILANVLSGVLLPLLGAFHHALRPGGWTILAGILAEEADMLREAAGAAGFMVEAEDREEQWWCVLLRRH